MCVLRVCLRASMHVCVRVKGGCSQQQALHNRQECKCLVQGKGFKPVPVSALCMCCVCVCARLCLSGGRSRWLFVPSHVPGSGLRIEAQSESHPCPVRGSPRILLMEELCMSGKACRILLRSSLAHTMKAFMGLLMWPEEGGGRASA